MGVDTTSRAFRNFGFDSFGQYFMGLLQLPTNLYHRAFSTQLLFREAVDESSPAMKRVLRALDLVFLGIGLIVGSGIFVTSGRVIANNAGPAAIISFLIAGGSALLSCLCYAEFAVEFPVAGGAYNYILATYGEMVSWLTTCGLIINYVLANAAVARAVAPFIGQLAGSDNPAYGTYEWNGFQVDWIAFGVVLGCTALLMFSTGGSSMFNLIVTGSQLVLILVIIISGLTKFNADHFTPFFPYGFDGVISGASGAFFSFIGFDAVATLSEEAKNPTRDMPIGIIGCILTVTVIYTTMIMVLVGMVPMEDINTSASFAAAFSYVGYSWGTYVVSVGALMGIVTGVLVGCLGVARFLQALARQHLVFPFMAHIHPKLGTPWVATVVLGIAAAIFALLTAVDSLVDMTAAAALLSFGMVAQALQWKRLYKPGVTEFMRPLVFQLVQVGLSIVFNWWYYSMTDMRWVLGIFAGALLLQNIAQQFLCPTTYIPAYACPFVPYIPTISVLLNGFLLGSIPQQSFIQLGIFFGACLAWYLLYGVQATAHLVQVVDEMLGGTDAFGRKSVSFLEQERESVGAIPRASNTDQFVAKDLEAK